MPLVEKRYAEALVDIALQDGNVDEYQNDLKSLAEMFDSQPEFRGFLLNEEIKSGVKKEVINNLFQDKIGTNLLNMLKLLVDKDRISLISGISDEFTRIAEKKRNILNMTIISAFPLDEEHISKLKEKYMKLYGTSSAVVKAEVDQSLIGGVKIIIGDKVIDGSVRGKMESLKQFITQ